MQAVRGMHDILPGEISLWRRLEAELRRVLDGHGYQEIRLPLVERTELFARSIGEITDIVEKEMYTFEDRNGDSLTLRPEGTAGCVRAALEHGLIHNRIQRLWYSGPMFRHERPQKGRYRQFYQTGAEAFGLAAPEVDAELIIMGAELWRRLGIAPLVRLEINTLGSPEARAAYREVLVEYLRDHYDRLDEDSRRRLDLNPLRVLDSKNPDMQPLIEAAPRLLDHLDEESRDHFARLETLLQGAGVAYHFNPCLVRGLDYYNRTVFEWVTDALGAQGTICAGGRYDGLVAQLGGRPTPACGFAVGMERVVALMEQVGVSGGDEAPHAFAVAAGDEAMRAALLLGMRLRRELPSLRLVNAPGGSLKSQFKKADRSGARWALVLGEDELEHGEVTVKDLRGKAGQVRLPQKQLSQWLGHRLASEREDMQ